MQSVTRRDFVRNSVAAGAAAATVVAPAAAESVPHEGAIKIVAISCSPRKGKSTATALGVCLQAAKEVSPRIETELVELAGLRIDGNIAAGVPLAQGEPDDFPPLVPNLADPRVRGIILGTPVYFGNMSSLCRAFLERCIVLYQDKFALRNKVAGVVAVGGTRNGGQEVTIQSVQISLFCNEMILVGNGRPSPRHGATVWSGAEGGVLKDEIGLTTVKALGRRVAEVALLVAGGH
ncbi:MAG: flavodoxin family protein [Planctomycetes bacterium]|jgi:multimeric flavodoxin WrbA|nr:flavodoxin family protein [Planctomycetota bacterium]